MIAVAPALFDADDASCPRTSTGSPVVLERLSVGLLVGTALLLGPAVGTSSSFAAPPSLHAISAGSGTGIGGFTSLDDITVSFGSRVPPIATAPVIRRLHDVSGLTWAELARLFSVSRRAVHAWATGARMNAVHTEQLSSLANAFANFDKADRDATRAFVTAPDASGRSEYERLLESLSGPAPTQARTHFIEGLQTRRDGPRRDPEVISIDYID